VEDGGRVGGERTTNLSWEESGILKAASNDERLEL